MPPMPTVVREWELTGRYRVRVSRLTGKVILVVEEAREIGRATGNGFAWSGLEKRWRDATAADVLAAPKTIENITLAGAPS